jgi:glucosamine-6-phosphate deaminase
MSHTINIQIFENRKLIGAVAASAVAEKIRELLKVQEEVNILFAAAPSQDEFLAALIKEDIRWNRINAFQMDEYIGLDEGAEQRFSSYLKKNIFEKILCQGIYYLNGNAADPLAECNRYAALLEQFPIDIGCIGIGENNHIAFNDPPVADFKDPETVKIVALDQECRQQQVNDKCFSSINKVPTHALTLTVPALFKSRYIFSVVPGERKAKAVYRTVNSPVTEQFPSTILKEHSAVQLFLDKESARLL